MQLPSPLYQQVSDVAIKDLSPKRAILGYSYILTVVRVKRSRNTFVFPGMAGREMATGRGYGEMETGRGDGGGGGGERGEDG